MPAFRMRVLSVAHGNEERGSWRACGPDVPLPPPPRPSFRPPNPPASGSFSQAMTLLFWALVQGCLGRGEVSLPGSHPLRARAGPFVPLPPHPPHLHPGGPLGTSLLGRGLSSLLVLGAQSKAGHSVQGGEELSLPSALRPGVHRMQDAAQLAASRGTSVPRAPGRRKRKWQRQGNRGNGIAA